MINAQDRLLDILHSRNRVEGLTHSFYRYPARFAPELAREVISEFSREGDCVLDTFMGGGTTIVEAIAAGRFSLCIDINPLAHFVSLVKTTPLSPRDKEAVLRWAENITIDGNITFDSPSETDPRLRNVPKEIKQFFIYATLQISQLEYPRQRRFARCALIKLGQWAIDCRSHIPSIHSVRLQLTKQLVEMLSGLDALVQVAKSHGISKNKITSRRKLFLGDVYDVIKHRNDIATFSKPKLVLTSPPYPGVHVLYHRWQINGRRETPAPYWLADLRDGHGESFYTLGGRSKRGIENYFMQLSEIFRDLRQFIDSESLVIQLVAFSDPELQLPAFLSAMNYAGYEELRPFDTPGLERPCREVPNRKWYTQLSQNHSASNEILLLHRPK
jgi:hypothetical protein